MQELEKILEEIEADFNRCIGIQIKIISMLGDEVRRYGYAKSIEAYQHGRLIVGEIIRNHMSGKDTDIPANDGWIPVEKRLPEAGEYVLGTNKYDEVLIYHYGWNNPRTRKMFFHLCGSAADIIAWRPLPEPYRPERSGE